MIALGSVMFRGVIVPGGFGDRGTQGKMLACQYARENKIPFLGLCLGFQMAVIEHARNVLGLKDANSEEMDPHTSHKVVIFMPEGSKTHLGGTMRLGERVSKFFVPSSKAQALYEELNGAEYSGLIIERHRHRYEVNPALIQMLEQQGLIFVAKDETGQRMEILERTGIFCQLLLSL